MGRPERSGVVGPVAGEVSREVEWLGGPQDGMLAAVADDAKWVYFNAPIYLEPGSGPDDFRLMTDLGVTRPEDVPVASALWRVPVRLRWLVWGERELVP